MKKYLFFISLICVTENVSAQDLALSKQQIYKPSFLQAKFLDAEKNIFMRNTGGHYSKKTELKKATFENVSVQSLSSKGLFFSKFYIKMYGGYGIFSPGSYRVQSKNDIIFFDQNNTFHDTTIQTQGNKGIGGGLRFGGGLGYVLNDFLNVGVDIEYQKTVKLKNTLSTAIDQNNYTSTYDEIHYKAITITPHTIFKALAKPNYFIYNKLGILFILPYSLHTSGNAVNFQGSHWPVGSSDSALSKLTVQRMNYEGNYKISLGIGFNVGFGINIRLSNKLRLFSELFGNFSALAPSSSQVITTSDYTYSAFTPGNYDYSTDPVTVLNYVPWGYKQISSSVENTKYQKGGATMRRQTSYSSVFGNPDEPSYYYETIETRDKRFTVNMNAIGINCGITYRF
ncbi:MAG: hypothetical protein ABJA71_09730 [Ginsengibacter sp.]